MAAKKRSANQNRQPAPQFRWWHVAIVVIVIAAVFMVLENLKKGSREEIAVLPQPVAPLNQPQPAPHDYEQKNYSSVVVAPPPVKTGTQPTVTAKGSMAIIIDDMGSSLQEAKELLAINIPLTFSIIPGLTKTKAVSAAARGAGRQVMVHLPMEPQGYPQQKLEQGGLLVDQSSEEITNRTEALLAAVPGAVGANNHMGSRFTEQEAKMLPVLKVLKEKGLFFVDSRTTPRSVAYKLAQRLEVKTASRSVFLDNEQDVAAISKQLYAAAEMARIKGGVIAICHPHPATIQALKTVLPELKKNGVRFVEAAELVR